MSPVISREIRLASRPRGVPTVTDFALGCVELDPLQDRQVLVRNLYMSVDPYMRIRMSAGTSFTPPFEVGMPLSGAAVGEVVASNAPEFKPGDAVLSDFGWREYVVASPGELRRCCRTFEPLSVYLGAFGMTGMTAWVGLNLLQVDPGDVVLISGAAGAVGHVAGQLAKQKGCRVIGATGSDEKVRFLKEDCGFDAAFNYHAGSALEQVRRAAPDGVDLYFDNVGGEMLEAALATLRVCGRIVACGGISGYNETEAHPGPANLFNVVAKRLTMRGFIVFDWLDRLGDFEREMGAYLKAGRVKPRETVAEGLERAPEALIGLFSGQNTGKMVVRLA